MSFKLKENEKYIFATDLDGTFLVDFNGSLHVDAFEAVKKIKDNGHYFVVATGRSAWWTDPLQKQLNSEDASIHFAGAIVHHRHNEQFDEYRTSLEKDLIKNMFKELDIWEIAEKVQAVGRKNHAYWHKGDDLNKLFFNCYELIIAFDNRKITNEEFTNRIKKVIGNNFIIRTWSFDSNPYESQLVISPKETNKAKALMKISKYYKVPQSNVIYFGDNVNDLEALKWAGYSFAPANAQKIAKDAADEVLELTNNEGAVPKKIIELLS